MADADHDLERARARLARWAPHAGAPAAPGRYRYGTAGRAREGTRVDYWVKVSGGRIEAVYFQVFGAPSAVAAAGWLAGRVRDMSPEQARAVSGLDICRALELGGERAGEALVAEDALAAALEGGDEVDRHVPRGG